MHGTVGAANSRAINHFDKADVVLSLDADFINCGPGSVRYQRDFAAGRRVMDDRKVMNRLYAIESTPTLTGAKADHRLSVKASEVEAVARELAGAVGGVPRPGAPDPSTGSGESRAGSRDDIAKWVAAIAKDLQAHRGRSVVVAGEYQRPPAPRSRFDARGVGKPGSPGLRRRGRANPTTVMRRSRNSRARWTPAIQMLIIWAESASPHLRTRFRRELTRRPDRIHGLYVGLDAHLSPGTCLPRMRSKVGGARSFDGTDAMQRCAPSTRRRRTRCGLSRRRGPRGADIGRLWTGAYRRAAMDY